MTTATKFASVSDFEKGGGEVIGNDQPRRYLFSNLFDVAAKSQPWERVVVAKNLEFTIECARAEGESPWYLSGHDETVLVMEGTLAVHFVQPAVVPGGAGNGATRLSGTPSGKVMGHVRLQAGHLALLPAGAAYQIRPAGLCVVLFQSLLGAESIERWAEICQH